MHLLIIEESKQVVDIAFLKQKLPGVEITLNSLPKEDGIAIFECASKGLPDNWQDQSILFGSCQLGRLTVDYRFPTDGATDRVLDVWTATESPEEEGTETGTPSQSQ